MVKKKKAKDIKKHLTSTVSREIQMKTTSRHYTHTQVDKLERDVEQLHSHDCGGTAGWYNHFGKLPGKTYCR